MEHLRFDADVRVDEMLVEIAFIHFFALTVVLRAWKILRTRSR